VTVEVNGLTFQVDEQHIEAVKRMGMLCVHDETIRQFAEEGRISKSEPPFGAFYWVDDKELEEIRSWEAEHGARVYMVVRSYCRLSFLLLLIAYSNNVITFLL